MAKDAEGFEIQPQHETATSEEGKSEQEEVENTEEATDSEEEPTGGEEEESGQGDDADPEEPKKPSKKGKGTQNRINKLTKEKSDAKAEAAYWKGVAEGKGAVKSEGQEPTPEPKEEELVKPREGDFENYEDFEAALVKYEDDLIDQKVEKRFADIAEKKEAAKKEEALKAKDEAFKESMDAGRETIEGFEAVDEFDQYTEAMLVGAKASENPAEVMHLIATDPEVHARLLELDPLAQIMAIGKMDAEFGEPTKKTNKPTPPVSKAPKPVGKGVGGKGSHAEAKTTDSSGDNLPIGEWMAKENERVASKAS